MEETGHLKSMGTRIRFVRDKVGGSVKLLEMTCVSQSQLSRLIRDDLPNPGIKQLQSIAKAGGVTMTWIVEGDTDEEFLKQLLFVDIPFFGKKEDKPLGFTRNYLEQEVGVDPEHCVLFRATDDAMTGTIHRGDCVLVDQSKHSGDGVFLIRIDEKIFLKRLQELPGVGVEVSSDNAAYKSYRLSAEQLEALEVIGQAVWVGSSL